jgi:hypothetical protein
MLEGRLERRVRAADLAVMRALTVLGGFMLGWPWDIVGQETDVSD